MGHCLAEQSYYIKVYINSVYDYGFDLEVDLWLNDVSTESMGSIELS